MNDAATTGATELKFTTTLKGGSRAYRYSREQMRWFPIAFATAMGMCRSGIGYDNTAYHAAEAVKLDRLTREMSARTSRAPARPRLTMKLAC